MQILLLKWLGISLTVLALPHLVSGFEVDSLGTALALALVLWVLNLILKPVLIFLTLPFTLLSFGFFLLFINAFVFWVSAQFVSGVRVESFSTAFWASCLLSLFSLLFSWNRLGFFRFSSTSTSKKTDRNTIELEKDPSGKWVG